MTPINKILGPEEVQKETGSLCLGFLEVVDLKRSKIQYLPVPEWVIKSVRVLFKKKEVEN